MEKGQGTFLSILFFLVGKFQKRKVKMVCELDLGENGFLTCFYISFRTNAKSDIIRPLMRHV